MMPWGRACCWRSCAGSPTRCWCTSCARGRSRRSRWICCWTCWGSRTGRTGGRWSCGTRCAPKCWRTGCTSRRTRRARTADRERTGRPGRPACSPGP
ncbi:hypothetical protein DMH25_47980, partial [Streptomyces sp. WAC 01325]